MRVLIQRVLKSELSIEGNMYSKINKGFLVLLGITHEDTIEDVKVLVDKISKLRIFEDENGKMNLSLKDVNGSMHIVSQFTLYADCIKGNRPSFTNAALPKAANELYEYFLKLARDTQIPVSEGKFGADMKINLVNDGPVTIMLECKDGKIV